MFYNETFNLPNGNLAGQDSWIAFSSAGSKPIQVNNGAASVVQSSGSGEDIYKATGSSLGAGATWYAAFDVTVTGATFTGTNGQGYFAHFMSAAALPTNTFDARAFIAAPNASGSGFTFGLGATSSLAQKWPTDFTFGTSHRLVLSYDYDTKVNKLWIDPVNDSSPFLSAASATSDALDAFSFRQASPNVANTQFVDNLAVATTFGEAFAGVPEPSTISLFAVGVLTALVSRRARNSNFLG